MRKIRLTSVTCLAMVIDAWIAGYANEDLNRFDSSHSQWKSVLETVVDAGLVNYEALANSPDKLDLYLTQLAAVSMPEFRSWTQDERLAFLINAYNAATLKLIADRYPLKSIKSIKSIGFLPHAAWRIEFINLFGRQVSLNHIEHELIRTEFTAQPEYHFALVCAAMGCPPLRAEPYLGGRLKSQLRDQGRVFLNSTDKNRVDSEAKIVYLSPIFEWYREDFSRGSRSVLAYLAETFPEGLGSELAKNDFNIRYTDYDWSLNDSGGSPPNK